MGDTNTQKLIRVLLSPAPELMATMMAVLTQRTVDTAIGEQLDVIGRRVGRPRQGLTDDEIYRRYVRAQIAANGSDGLIDDILTVAELVINDPAMSLVLKNEGAAAFSLEIGGVALSDDVAQVLIRLVLKATSAGVRAIIEYSNVEPSQVGRWSTQGTWGSARWARAADKEL